MIGKMLNPRINLLIDNNPHPVPFYDFDIVKVVSGMKITLQEKKKLNELSIHPPYIWEKPCMKKELTT